MTTTATVTIKDAAGHTTQTTVAYTVTAPPPPSTLVRYGISQGNNINASVNGVHAKVVRAFATVTANYSSLNIAAMTAAIPVHLSFKSPAGDVVFYDKTDPGYVTNRTNMRACLAAFPKVGAPHYFGVHHEPFGDGTVTPAQWAQAHLNVATDVLAFVNQARPTADRFVCVATFNGFPAAMKGVDPYFPASLITGCANAGVDFVAGIDCYGLYKQSSNPAVLDPNQQPPNDQVTAAHDFAKRRGLKWCIPELGAETAGQSAPSSSTTDANILFEMQTYKTLEQSWPAAERPVYVCQFNGNASEFINTTPPKPNSVTYWRGLCDTGAGN